MSSLELIKCDSSSSSFIVCFQTRPNVKRMKQLQTIFQPDNCEIRIVYIVLLVAELIQVLLSQEDSLQDACYD
uniref:Uncharacterized protein n=1 Tax=Arion vulgaris TaxID=1028688 RepID=A0A0B7APQ4_9EUPU